MTQNFESFSDAWSQIHGGVRIRGVVSGWLKFSYRAALVLSKIRVSANFLTALGVAFSAFAAISSPAGWCALFLLLSIFSDGIDGSLALVQKRQSVMGAMYDSIADRVSDGLWAIAFYRLGAPIQLVIAAWIFASVQEFARARLGSDGVREIGVVSISERPVRGLLIFAATVAFQFDFSSGCISTISWIWTVIQLVALSQILVFARKSLR